MYFWKVNALAEDLKNRRVTQRQKMQYYLANTLLYLSSVYITGLIAVKPNLLTGINILLGLAITAGGILLCYKANSQGDDEEFIDRMVCLSWPISMRMIVVLIPIYIASALIFAGNTSQPELNIADVAITVVYSIYFYKWLHTCLLKISQPANTVNQPV